MQGCLAYAKDSTTVMPLEEEPDKPRSVVFVSASWLSVYPHVSCAALSPSPTHQYVRFYAHKLKSTAGAPLLWRLAKAAEAVELPLKPLAQVEESGTEVPAADLTALCDTQMKGDLDHLTVLVREAAAALRYISVGVWEALDEDEAEEARDELEEEEAAVMTQEAADTAVAELEALLSSLAETVKPTCAA